MKKILALSVMLIISAGYSQSYSQVVTRLLNRAANKTERSAEERMEKEAEKGVEKKVNKALNKIFGTEEDSISSDSSAVSESTTTSSSAASSDAKRNAWMNAMGMSAGTVNAKPVYEFDGFIEMTITNFEQNDPIENTAYTTYVDSKSLDYGMIFREPDSNDESVIIFDTENDLMLTLGESDGEKTGFAISFTPEQAEAITEEMKDDHAEEAEDGVTDPYNAYKTGKTKKILGYKCDEYRIEEEEENEVVTMWITKDLSGEIKKSYLKNSSFTGLFMYAYSTEGMVLEYILEDLSDDTRTEMTVTDIDMNKRNSISTQGYMIMNMAGMMQEEDDAGDESEKSGEDTTGDDAGEE